MPPKRVRRGQPTLPKRVFVTGGSGFIGSHVVSRLLAKGCEVVCLVLPSDPAPALEGLDVEIVRGDLSDTRALSVAMKGAKLVFHLAAIYALWLKRPAKMFEVNVDGTRHVLQAARMAGVTRVVHTSSIAAVGTLPGRRESDESVQYNNWAFSNDYVLSKYLAEVEALSHVSDDLEVVAVNPAFPFGAQDRGPTPTGRIVAETLRGTYPFVFEGGFNAVDVRDVADGHLLAALHGRSGERYILGGHNVSYAFFAREVARRVGRRPPPLTLGAGPVKSIGWLMERMVPLFGHQQPPTTYRTALYTVGRYLWFSTAKAERELGYQPRPLAEGIDASVAWFRARSRSEG